MGETRIETHQVSFEGDIIPDISLKNQIRAKKISQGLMDGKTYTQIAEEIGISRPALYAVMGKQEVQTLMERELRTLETTVLDWIMELKNSTSKIDRRIATQELAKITKHYADKLYPNLLRTETLSVNVDLTHLQEREHRFTQALNQTPPTCRQAFWKAYNNQPQQDTVKTNTHFLLRRQR